MKARSRSLKIDPISYLMKPCIALIIRSIVSSRLWLPTKGLLLFVALTIGCELRSQGPPSMATQAAQLCQDKKLDEAFLTIQKALEDPIENQKSYTWYVHGFVCKEIYKTREANLRHSTWRMQAIDAFEKAETIEPSTDANGTAALRYLMNTLYNDAVLSSNDFTLNNEFKSDSLFTQYKAVADRLKLLSERELRENETQFLKSKAQHYFELWNNQSDSDYGNTMAIQYYSKALELAPDDCVAVYNIGVAYYDQAVAQATTEGLLLSEMTRVQIAHTYFVKASSICPEDPMIQSALKLTSAHSIQKTNEPRNKLLLRKK